MATHSRHRANNQNQHIGNKVLDVNKAVQFLILKGLTVLKVIIEGRNPLIWVQNSPHCDELKGVCSKMSHGEDGREEHRVAIVNNCQVQWLVKGH